MNSNEAYQAVFLGVVKINPDDEHLTILAARRGLAETHTASAYQITKIAKSPEDAERLLSDLLVRPLYRMCQLGVNIRL